MVQSWKIQLNEEVTVTLTMDTNIGLFVGYFFSGYASRTGSWKIRSLLEMRWRDCGNG